MLSYYVVYDVIQSICDSAILPIITPVHNDTAWLVGYHDGCHDWLDGMYTV